MDLRPIPTVVYTGRYTPPDLTDPAQHPARYDVWVHDDTQQSRVPLSLEPSQRIEKRSMGFAWGYGGAGPRQLALALLVDAVDRSLGTETPEGASMIATLRDEGFDRTLMEDYLRDPGTVESEWCIPHGEIAGRVNQLMQLRAFEARLVSHFDALLRTPDLLDRYPDLPEQLARMAMTAPDELLSRAGQPLPGEEPVSAPSVGPGPGM